MVYTSRFQELLSQYRFGKQVKLTNSGVSIQHLKFKSHACFDSPVEKPKSKKSRQWFFLNKIKENKSFQYPVFLPAQTKKTNQAILMLHGLNERNWNKYLSWAEYLCQHSGKAVILFPIAHHMNRSPISWTNPRLLENILNIRRANTGNDRSLSFANVVLSERLSRHPELFYQSGRQSYDDIVRLLQEIKTGKHPLFYKNTQIDVFAYSIGALLAQTLFLTNPELFFSDSRLFMFCGGSIFNAMQGTSRSIMDKLSFDTLFAFYQTGNWAETYTPVEGDPARQAFYSMLTPDNDKDTRISKFEKLSSRIKGILLAADVVIPHKGVIQALGENCSSQTVELLDFPFRYTHENPFPVNKGADSHAVDLSFQRVFDSAVEFLT